MGTIIRKSSLVAYDPVFASSSDRNEYVYLVRLIFFCRWMAVAAGNYGCYRNAHRTVMYMNDIITSKDYFVVVVVVVVFRFFVFISRI